MNNTKGQWYLPAAGELYHYLYGEGIHYNKINTTWNRLGITLSNKYFWSSSEYTTNDAWRINFNYGTTLNYYKTYLYSVCCFLSISNKKS